MDLVKAKTSFAFNRICINFLKEIKSRDIGLKKKIKKNYKVYDKSSQDHIIYFWNKMNPVHETLQKDDIQPEDLSDYVEQQLLNNSEFCEIYFLRGIQIGKLFNIFSNEKEVILSYIMTLYLFGYLYNDINEENYNEIDSLLQTTLKVIHSIDSEFNNITGLLDNILDDTIKHILLMIKSLKIHMVDNEQEKNEANNNPDLDSYADLIDNSKIGSIAKDICSSLKDINIDPNSSPEELMSSIFSGSNNMIGNLIEQVGSTLTNKINNGEINQEELIGDAFKLIGKLNNDGNSGENNFMGDLFKNVMGSMGNSGNNMPDFGDIAKQMSGKNIDKNKVNQLVNQNKTKERLKKKLEDKKNNDNS
jgi:hypothetical protein